MVDPKVVLVLAALGLLVIGAKTVAVGVKTAAVKTSHAIVRVVKHPIHSIKNGAIHEPESSSKH